jgi:drug/metabolite transporter (DMT)-like permease
MNMKWKLLSGFVMGFLFLPLVYMLDKYVGPGAGSIAIAMIGIGISVATCVWLIEKMRML